MVSPSHLPHGFRLGPWQVEPPRGAITGPDGQIRHLEPKVMDVLAILAAAPGELVTRDHLLDAVWRSQPGADQLLTHAVSELRRALEDRRDLEGDPGSAVAATLEAFDRAARRQPNHPEILRILSWKLAITGYLSEALAVTERFIQLDPLASMAHVRRAAVLAALERTGEAEAEVAVAERLNPDWDKWVIGESHLAHGRDETAIAYFEGAVSGNDDSGDTSWIRELVTAARETGQAALDERAPLILAAMPEAGVAATRFRLNCLYLMFGHLDRYFRIILDDDTVSSLDREYYVWWGMVYRRMGFTAHPRYPEVARLMGFTEAWERRGPPDFCERESGNWICR